MSSCVSSEVGIRGYYLSFFEFKGIIWEVRSGIKRFSFWVYFSWGSSCEGSELVVNGFILSLFYFRVLMWEVWSGFKMFYFEFISFGVPRVKCLKYVIEFIFWVYLSWENSLWAVWNKIISEFILSRVIMWEIWSWYVSCKIICSLHLFQTMCFLSCWLALQFGYQGTSSTSFLRRRLWRSSLHF